ncbi:multimeric flavodoxin WrbA [Pedobacter sp. CAN_A7]|uniref:flavodoxin family protein n=1 Tax=Pedobacter sp. CAN_A7 TaxID=2787722 RepID=UPI0018C951E6
MKAVILLGTLKKTGLSNTETLSAFFVEKLEQQGVTCEVIKLVDHPIFAGTYDDMGAGDAWPAILEKILAARILIFATPIWWDNHSSEVQRVIERLDEVHDMILAGETSRLANKVGGILITGDSDGAQHIIGNISNFLNAVGVLIPPYCTLSVLSQEQAKGVATTREALLEKYESEYSQTAETMVAHLLRYI